MKMRTVLIITRTHDGKSLAMKYSHLMVILLATTLLLWTTACSDNEPNSTDNADDVSDAADVSDTAEPAGSPAYSFESKLIEGESSVSYTGQIARHLLLDEIHNTIDSMDTNSTYVTGQVIDLLDSYYRFDSAVVTNLPLTTMTTPGAEANLEDVSTGKNLQSKIAGVDSTGWDVTTFGGWTTPLPTWTRDEVNRLVMTDAAVPTSPGAMVESMFAKVEELALLHTAGTPPQSPDGEPITTLYVDANGIDYKQMIQKFLGMAVFFSQGTGDYLYQLTGSLNQDTPADNVTPYDDNRETAYTAMEHKYDESFGYFGAARHYDQFTDDEIVGKAGREGWQQYNDANGDEVISFKSEYNFGHSQNAAERDLGTQDNGDDATDFTADVFNAFVQGRQIIDAAEGNLRAEQLGALDGHIDTIIRTWEKVIAATVVHYINDVLTHTDNFGTDEYSFSNHAKHWSEMKGFALGLQFNPNSPMHDELDAYCYNRQGVHAIEPNVTQEDCLVDDTGHWNPQESRFARFHRRIGDAPVLPSAAPQDGLAYGMSLNSARTILAEAYGFAAVNVQSW